MLYSLHSEPKLDLQSVAHVSTSSPHLPGGQRVRPNEFYRIVKNKVFDLRCFCGETVSVFPFPKQDSLIKGHHVAMCKKKKGCKFFGSFLVLFHRPVPNVLILVDLTAAYADALYFPLGQSSFDVVPPLRTQNKVTPSSHIWESYLLTHKATKTLTSTRRNVAATMSVRGEFSSGPSFFLVIETLTCISRC